MYIFCLRDVEWKWWQADCPACDKTGCVQTAKGLPGSLTLWETLLFPNVNAIYYILKAILDRGRSEYALLSALKKHDVMSDPETLDKYLGIMMKIGYVKRLSKPHHGAVKEAFSYKVTEKGLELIRQLQRPFDEIEHEISCRLPCLRKKGRD